MKKFIILFREPDGRTGAHSDTEISAHQDNWKNWFNHWGQQGNLVGGSGLTLNGRMIKGKGDVIIDGIYKHGTEIVGGYLLLNAVDLDEATEIMKSCPIYEFDGFTEIRELQIQN
ncbi:hypothetical protein GCM10023231_12080 [Olivibacter ginsenosidimutans]|uniref:YCII-related domain-containing protein n=1 Tax=Olivibacter ginsenosidimutans TaxID=1176537 RepID=A0ABP9ATM2_9SPHI